MGPTLLASLFALVAWSFIQIFFPVGPVGETIFSLFGAVIFSGCVVFDTANLIKNYDLDQVCPPPFNSSPQAASSQHRFS